MTCQWRVNDVSMTCQWRVNDVSMTCQWTCQWRVNDVSRKCQGRVNDVSMTCQWRRCQSSVSMTISMTCTMTCQWHRQSTMSMTQVSTLSRSQIFHVYNSLGNSLIAIWPTLSTSWLQPSDSRRIQWSDAMPSSVAAPELLVVSSCSKPSWLPLNAADKMQFCCFCCGCCYPLLLLYEIVSNISSIFCVALVAVIGLSGWPRVGATWMVSEVRR